MLTPTPRTVSHEHSGPCLAYSPSGRFVCTVTLLPLSIMTPALAQPQHILTAAVLQAMANLAALSPQERAADYESRYKGAIAAAFGQP